MKIVLEYTEINTKLCMGEDWARCEAFFSFFLFISLLDFITGPSVLRNRMPKRTFGLLDVAASVRDVQRSCVGYRAANVYDIDLKTYLFKLQKKDKPKQGLLMESGVRFHVTDFVRDKSDSPSHFSMKLRKHIRTRVLSSVTQLGNDRVVDFGFGQGEACYHIILEMYAKGNMVLTDYQYNILGLLRSHTYD